MAKCNPAQQAFVRVYFLNSVSTPKDYRMMRMGARRDLMDWPTREGRQQGVAQSLNEVTWELHEQYPQPDVPKHGSAVLGLPDAAAFLSTCDEDVQRKWLRLVNSSVGSPAWTLVSYAAWMSAADRGVLDWMDDVGWFDNDVRDSIDAGKERLVAVRRSLALAGQLEVGVDQVLALRKMANISDRNKDEADWEAERRRRTIDTPVHWYPMAGGGVSRQRWLQECRSYLESFTLRVARKMSGSLRLVELDEWWASRYNWVSTGSSSMAAQAREVLEKSDMEPDKQSRPNKKAVAVTLPEEYIYLQMLRRPFKNPRKSTKHEPGRKNRALYAQDDASFFVSAYGSVAMERSINEEGILARQAPEDVVHWMGLHKRAVASKMFFLSLDYSDYNAEHETIVLAMLDAAWARAWSLVAEGRPVYHQKAWAALWSARAHLNSWVDFGHGDERGLGGLFSGDRNTSRDNCIKHALYSHCMQKATREMIPGFKISGLCMTGDDEDAAFGSSVQAACYMANHACAGFELKVQKQIAGTYDLPTHEYLQRALTNDGRPSRPLAAALAQLCSGNWYKTQYTWFDSVINSVNDNAWELHTRGLPLLVCRFLASKILSRSLTVPGTDRRRDLEWWDYRTNGAYHPLWGCTTKAAPSLPDSKAAIKADPNQHGIIAWSGLLRKRFGRRYPEMKARRYEYSCAQQALSSVFVKDRFQMLADAAAEVWPTRVNRRVPVLSMDVRSTPRLSEAKLTHLVTHLAATKTPETRREVLSRFGVDEELVETLGGMREFRRALRPADMQYWSSVREPTQLPKWACHEDPAVRSQLGNVLGTAATQYERFDKQDSNEVVDIIVAGNATGKTTAMATTQAGLLIDMDEVMRKSGVGRLVKLDRRLHGKLLPSGLALRVARELRQTPGRVLLSQYPLPWMLQIIRAANLRIRKVLVVMSSALTIWERSANDRAWSMAKAERRAGRANKTVAAYQEHMEVRIAPNVLEAVKQCQKEEKL